MVISFGCGWNSGSLPQSLHCWRSCNVPGKMDIEGMEGGNGVVMEAAREDGM